MQMGGHCRALVMHKDPHMQTEVETSRERKKRWWMI
jgi:hypothetical protein